MKITLMNKLIILFTLLLSISACKEDIIKPVSIGKQPDPITDYVIESLPGGAKITFTVPTSEDLLYVMAEYEISQNVKREVKSSVYKNHLIIEGFAKEGEYDVTLYAVAKGEIKSVPTPVKVTALIPPYINAYKSLTMTAVFGGINVSFNNKDEGNLVFQILALDSTSHWKAVYTHYTRFMEGNFSIRGYDTINMTFGVYVRDRWANISDTLSGVFKPLYESLIPKSKFQALKLPGDAWQAHSGVPTLVIEKVWNDNTSASDDCFHTNPNSGMPQHFSFDMGVPVKLSRFNYVQRPSTRWSAGNPRIFELWGTNNPNTDGSWDSWTKIGTYTSVKPSGLPLGTNSSEDIALAIAGENFDVPLSIPTFRYYRWNTIATWGNVTYISIAELTFWGSVEE